MRNLDQSISNAGDLDESFSNITAAAAFNPAIMNSPMRPTSGSIKVNQTDFMVKPANLVAPIVTSSIVPAATPIVSPVATTSQPIQQPVFMGGGGGGGYSEPTETEEESSLKREGDSVSNNDKIFGMNPILAYSIGAASLVFIYFKFIKK